MNKITPHMILVEHPIFDKDGTRYEGFYGIFAKEDQEEPDYLQQELLSGYSVANYVTFFGSITDTVDHLNKFVRHDIVTDQLKNSF